MNENNCSSPDDKPIKYALNKRERRLICAFIAAEKVWQDEVISILESHPKKNVHISAEKVWQDEVISTLESHPKKNVQRTEITKERKCRIITMPPPRK